MIRVHGVTGRLSLLLGDQVPAVFVDPLLSETLVRRSPYEEGPISEIVVSHLEPWIITNEKLESIE